MRRLRTLALLLAALAAAPAGVARADVYCAGVDAPGCTAEPSAHDAFDAAAGHPGADAVRLGALQETGGFGDAGQPLRVTGAGSDATVLRGDPALRLSDPGSSARALTLQAGGGGLALRLAGGGVVLSALVLGRVLADPGAARLESVAVLAPGPAVDVGCGADVTANHLTAAGAGPSGIRLACPGRFTLRNAIVWGYDRPVEGGGVDAAFSDLGATDPAFVASDDPHLRADSPLVDAGDPAPLTGDEAREDAGGDVRVVDGNGDGAVRRDVGAYERQPPPPPAPDGNVLANPGAEDGVPAADDASSPAPPGWTRSGGFTFVRYGTVAGDVPFPSQRAAAALGAGEAFFAGGPGTTDSSATQSVDLSAAAPEIDAGAGAAALSALLGGYDATEDAASVRAAFLGPDGSVLGALQVGPVAAAERGNATTLVPRAAHGPIPPLTRIVAVTMRAVRASGAYDDGYLDRVAFVPAVPGAPPPAPPAQPGSAPLRPFAGVAVLSRRAAVDSRGRAWVRLGCSSRTVGSCRGTVTLASARSPQRYGLQRFALRAGHSGRVAIRLGHAVRARLRRRRLSARLFAAARDGQGVTRTTTAPVRIERAAHRRARSRGRPGTSAGRARPRAARPVPPPRRRR